MASSAIGNQSLFSSHDEGGLRRQSSWLPGFPERNDGKLRLFCFPFAGGSGEYYRSWQSELGDHACVCPVELPGRGSRSCEPFATSLIEVARQVGSHILSRIDGPFAFFGHSLGGMLGIEVAMVLKDMGGPLPELFLTSGTPPPHSGMVHAPDPDSPDALLKELIRRFGGTPAEILDEPELAAFFLPIFRSDFRLAHTHVAQASDALDMTIAVLAGRNDPDTPEAAMRKWGELSLRPSRLHFFPGGHFFLEEQRLAVLQTVIRELRSVLVRLER